MTAHDLRAWLRRSAPALARRGISATHGIGPRLNAEGATWISFSSPTGSGRLVRDADGSSASRALRYRDGAVTLDTSGPTTTEAQLVALTDALAPA